MEKKLSLLCCLITIIIVGSCVFISNNTIDFPTILHSLQIICPAALIAYICGFYMGKTLSNSKVDTDILNAEVQQQFVDDLLLSPDEVLNLNYQHTQPEKETDNKSEQQSNEQENQESKA